MLWKRLEDVQLQERSCVHVMSLISCDDSGVVSGLSCYLLATDTRLRDRSSPLALDIISIHRLQVLIPYTIVPDLIAWPNSSWCLSQYSSMKHRRHPRLYTYFVFVIPLWSSTWLRMNNDVDDRLLSLLFAFSAWSSVPVAWVLSFGVRFLKVSSRLPSLLLASIEWRPSLLCLGAKVAELSSLTWRTAGLEHVFGRFCQEASIARRITVWWEKVGAHVIVRRLLTPVEPQARRKLSLPSVSAPLG